MVSEDSDDLPTVELFVQAAPTDKGKKGSSLSGQQWHMALYRLVEMGIIKLRLTPIAPDYTPEEYRRLDAARHLPVAWIESGKINNEELSGVAILTTEALYTFLEKINCRNLDQSLSPLKSLVAEQVYIDLYMNFMDYLHNNNEKPLNAGLKKLDEFLQHKKTKYFLSNDLTVHDCQLMPKLQQIRVLGHHYKNYDIPTKFAAIWKYIDLMYETDAFNISCPADIDIIMRFEDKYPDMNAPNPKPKHGESLRGGPEE
ncbi:unnamed protein product [Calicophoron daubneyi]|uniref:Chloride intracellular channel n=1 Tax=Calicophoron daubneyi TaxID=300641 RepID=A0AAV2SYW8_CALDB